MIYSELITAKVDALSLPAPAPAAAVVGAAIDEIDEVRL
jgi:hypothetical protein